MELGDFAMVAGWPVSPGNLPDSISSELRLQGHTAMLAFYVGTGDLNSGP